MKQNQNNHYFTMNQDILFLKSRELVQNKHMKTANFIIPKKMSPDAYIICIKTGSETKSEIQAFLYFSVYPDSIHINYSFTFPQYRRMGLSTILRKYLIQYAIRNEKRKITSVPFETAHSLPLLQKLGFQKEDETDAYVLQLYR
jgi:GNAT superfamily N-acetyltransferase